MKWTTDSGSSGGMLWCNPIPVATARIRYVGHKLKLKLIYRSGDNRHGKRGHSGALPGIRSTGYQTEISVASEIRAAPLSSWNFCRSSFSTQSVRIFKIFCMCVLLAAFFAFSRREEELGVKRFFCKQLSAGPGAAETARDIAKTRYGAECL